MSKSWPEEVTVLDASMIHKGWFDGPNNTHCLSGWAQKDFGFFHTNKILDKIEEICKLPCGESVEWNDKITTKKSRIAQAYNRATALFGYTEGNPEKRWAEAYLKKRQKTVSK